MNKWVNTEVVNAAKPLKAAHFPFPRAKELFEVLSWCVTDYYTKASIGRDFEARGVLVVADSRQGKTRELQRLIDDFNSASVIMPDGRPAKMIRCILSGKVTWKDLGLKILDELGYRLKGRHSQTQIWDMVVKYAELQGVVGIHFDECQHVFSEEGDRTNQQFLDSFKTLLKDARWPLMLILSGVPSLATHIAKEEQLTRLLRVVHFKLIDLTQQADMDEMVQLTFSYAEKAGLDFEPLATTDFIERLAFTCCDRWGLVIEMLIEAFTSAVVEGETVCSVDHFTRAYATLYGGAAGYSPLTAPNYRDNFDQQVLFDMFDRMSEKKGPSSR